MNIKRKKIVIAVTLALSLAQQPALAGFGSIIQLSDLDGTTGFRLDGVASGDKSGRSVSTAGDVNGDGIDDLLIGAIGADPNGSYSGSSYVVFGKNTPFNPSLDLGSLDGTTGFRLDGTAEFDFSGRAVSTAGDVNGDGFDDLLIGAPYADNGNNLNHSFVVFGKNTPFSPTLNLSSVDGTTGFRLDGVEANDNTGFAVSAAGDINGDGIADLLIGARFGVSNNNANAGSSYVVFGKTTGFNPTLNLSSLNGTTGFRLNGAAANDRSGDAVSAAGDVNGDGFDDILIGAKNADPNGSNAGSSYVVFGKSTAFSPTLALGSLDGTSGFRLDGVAQTDNSGNTVSSGDINGDGFDDLIIGAPRADPNGISDAGSIYVVFGKSSPFDPVLALATLDGTNGFQLDGVRTEDRTGYAVSIAGDINGDGFDDLMIGAPYSDPNGSSSGSSYVVFGKNTPFDASLNLGSLFGEDGFRLDGAAVDDRTGYAMSAAGDVNGDGFDDLIIAAPFTDLNGSDSGSSYVVFGRFSGDPLVDFDQKLNNFGDTFVGITSDTLTVTISNPGTGLAVIDTITLADPAFTIIGGDCGTIPIRIIVDESCSLDFQFTPQAVGNAVTEVAFDSNSITSPDSITLLGNGVLPPVVSLLPDPLVFDDTALGNSLVETLMVENIGASTLEPGTVSIQGAHLGDFSVDVNNCIGAQLEAGQFCDIDVRFTPTAVGSRQAILQLESNTPTSPDFVELRASSDVIFKNGFE